MLEPFTIPRIYITDAEGSEEYCWSTVCLFDIHICNDFYLNLLFV